MSSSFAFQCLLTLPSYFGEALCCKLFFYMPFLQGFFWYVNILQNLNSRCQTTKVNLPQLPLASNPTKTTTLWLSNSIKIFKKGRKPEPPFFVLLLPTEPKCHLWRLVRVQKINLPMQIHSKFCSKSQCSCMTENDKWTT